MARWHWYKSKPKQQLRKRIHERDNFTCCSCGWKPSVIPKEYDGSSAVGDHESWLEIDHILALHNGGTNDESNLQTLCKRCNCKKGVK